MKNIDVKTLRDRLDCKYGEGFSKEYSDEDIVKIAKVHLPRLFHNLY